ncbi:MAG: penicillin-binding protein 1C [Dehalococcoidia bacterium]
MRATGWRGHRGFGRGVTAGLVCACLFWAYVLLAPVEPPGSRVGPAGVAVLAADGSLLQRDQQNGIRVPVPLGEVAPVLIDATVAAEDQRFWDHPGVDLLAVARALSQPWSRSGASTITQQTARRLYLDGGWLPVRKTQEALLALRLEAHASKREILEAYLNDAPYGRGASGIEAAARIYFGVSARDLDLAQASFLAGIPRLPSLSVERDFDRLKARQRYVLDRMVATGSVSAAEAAEARAEPLRFQDAEQRQAPAPHFVRWALDELEAVLPRAQSQHGLVVETTLDLSLQREAERIALHHLAALRERSVQDAAVVVLDPRTGAVLAMIGNLRPDGPTGQVNLTTALRQPGSALKPFLYAQAMDDGSLTAASQLLDVPTTFETREGPYSPQNYDRRFRGPVTLRVALASSLNVPAVRTLEAMGRDRFLEAAHRVGLQTLTDADRYGPALVLGGGEVRLLDLAQAYGVLANRGVRQEPFAVLRVRDQAGHVLYERPGASGVRALSEASAWLVSDVLRDPLAREPGFGANSPLETPGRAAVKTGTTSGFRDNWTIGYTPDRVVAVWAGNADGSPMESVSGVAGAAPIWHDVLLAAVPARAVWAGPPAGVVQAKTCAPTGLAPGPDCPNAIDEWFLAGTVPTQREQYYQRDAGGALRVSPPPEARAWAADAGLRLSVTAAGPVVRVITPEDGAVFALAPEVPDQRIVLRATAEDAATLELRIGGRVVASGAGNDISFPWPLTPGRHTLTAVATFADGHQATGTASFEVRPR